MSDSIPDLREEYTLHALSRKDLDPDPFSQFGLWFGDARAAEARDANAMTLATATPEGEPFARTVLLKGFDARGFLFFTNYTSAKGRQLGRNPRAALLFYWKTLERQVSIGGVAEKVSREESEVYFKSRPLGSRLGAWASAQSEPVPNRAVLEEKLAQYTEQFGAEVPLPPTWGGYRVIPDSIEFWQGRQDRLHDRFRYTRSTEGSWRIERISP